MNEDITLKEDSSFEILPIEGDGDFTREHEAVEKDYILIEHMSNSFPSDFYNESFKNMSNNVNLFPRSSTSLLISDVDTNHDLTEIINIDCKETDEDNNQNHELENNSKGQMLIKAVKNPITGNTLPLNYKLVDKSVDNFQPEKESNSCNETLNISNELMNNSSIIENHHQGNLNIGKDDEITEYHPLMNENKRINPYEFRIQIENPQFNSHPNNQANKQQQILNHDGRKCINNEYSAITCKNKRINPSEFKRYDFKQETGSNRIPRLGERRNCSDTVFQIMDNGIQFCSWIQNRKCVQRFVKRAKSSFNSIVNTVELEINQMLGSQNPLRLTIIADAVKLQAIEEAFVEVFRGQIFTTAINIDLDTIPLLPIGNSAGLQAAESKISYARRYKLTSEDAVIVSAVTLLDQAVLQRWQMATVIYLDDPNLKLCLHNITATIPIPNEYVKEAERLTPPNYHLRDKGLALSIEQAIYNLTKLNPKDAQEFLTGINPSITLKSAALVLAGLYKKFLPAYI
ncbi:protein PRRC1-A [Trichonephila inaurata madagascariensis]|uniref:Protein PRRC1-A n=1 Tax=Trichonephila inaurata madagascariensis TaxID=2747483 RepID=A0A8X6X9C2_9ARAC|nr:protein PRRC1-A [Trichonephila inaurata madagascariensis]